MLRTATRPNIFDVPDGAGVTLTERSPGSFRCQGRDNPAATAYGLRRKCFAGMIENSVQELSRRCGQFYRIGPAALLYSGTRLRFNEQVGTATNMHGEDILCAERAQ
jgi:hypothetical protein